MINLRLREMAWLGVFLLGAALGANAQIDESEKVHLETRTSDGVTKLGIWIGIAGGEKGLFEFDTGGAGFYAVRDSVDHDKSKWWGTNYTPTGTFVTNTYQSGYQYVAEVVNAPIVIYDKDGSAKLTSPSAVSVGMTTSISNTNTGVVSWPGTPHPVDGSFEGDFGLSLKAGEGGLLNVLMQMNYATNLTAGFAVHVGPAEDMSGAYLRIGLTADEIASYPIQIDVSGQKNNGGYKLALFNSLMTLATGGTTNYSGTLGIALDTGNPTPGLHNTETGVPEYLITGGQLSIDQLLTLITEQANGTNFTMTSFETGTNYGTNLVYIVNSSGSNYYLNLGMPFFNQYDVMFDFENGIVGLKALPEANTATLVLAALGGFWVFGLGARFSRRRRKARW